MSRPAGRRGAVVPQGDGGEPPELEAIAAPPAGLDVPVAMMPCGPIRKRDEVQADADLLELCEDPAFAVQAVDYDKRSGDPFLTVEFAREARRCWGNIRSGIRVRPVGRGYSIEGWALDSERGISESVEHFHPPVILRKRGGAKVASWVETDDLDALRGTILAIGSRLERNALLRLLPRRLVQVSLATCLATARRVSEGKGPKATSRTDQLRAVVLSFGPFGVRRAEIDQALGHSLEKATGADLEVLRGVLQRLRDGSTWEAELAALGRGAPAPQPAPQGRAVAG